MTDDLTARLTGALRDLETREDGLRPDAAELAALHRDVRRRRTLRATQHASVAAVTVVAVGIAGWFGLQRAPLEPVETPSPSPTSTVAPSPSTTPTPSPTPTPTGQPREDTTGLAVVERPGVGTLYAMPPGLLDRTGPGWTLVRGYGHMRGDVTVSEGVVSLVAPDGTAYFVADVVGSTMLQAWDGGPTAVVLTQTAQGELGVRGTLDLRTGEVRPDAPTIGRLSRLVGRAADGAEVWEGYGPGGTTTEVRVVAGGTARTLHADLRSGSTVHLSPDGRRVAVDELLDHRRVLVTDVATGTTTPRQAGPADHLCRTVGWWDATTVLQECYEGVDEWGSEYEEGPEPTAQRLVLVDADGGDPVVLAEIGPGDVTTVGPVLHVGGDRVVVGPLAGAGAETSAAWVWRDGAWAPLTTQDLGGRVLAADAGADGRVVLGVWADDPLAHPYGVLWSVDVRSGDAVQLTQEPPDDPSLTPFGSADHVPARP